MLKRLKNERGDSLIEIVIVIAVTILPIFLIMSTLDLQNAKESEEKGISITQEAPQEVVQYEDEQRVEELKEFMKVVGIV